MEKYLLIAGCSHAAGSEIDGTEDSEYNRQHSFGNLLAEKLKRIPINIGYPGATNTTISRSILGYFENNYKDSIDLSVLISWTDSSRVEAIRDYQKNGHRPKFSDWEDLSALDYMRINAGTPVFVESERELIEHWQTFLFKNDDWLELYSLNLILQIQFFLKYKNIKYIMCNAGHMCKKSPCTVGYTKFIDNDKFLNLFDATQSFYEKYKLLGYKNEKARYWHHGEEPHKLFSEELLEAYQKNYGNS